MSEDEKPLVITNQNPNAVPAVIDRKTAMECGHTPQYMLKMCSQYGITAENLNQMIQLKKEYPVKISTMFHLIGGGLSVPEISGLLETRESLTSEEFPPSLRKLVAFYQAFGIPMDDGYLTTKIKEMHQELHCKNISRSINVILKAADSFPGMCLEALVDFTKGKYSNFGSDKYRESSRP